jgi:hypothetical protein
MMRYNTLKGSQFVQTRLQKAARLILSHAEQGALFERAKYFSQR